MRLIDRFYNEDRFRLTAEDHLAGVTKEDAKLWIQHPCTRCLTDMLQADMCGIINMWLEGGYGDENSIDITAQRQAKARGMSQAIDDIIEKMQQISNLDTSGEVDDTASGAQNPYQN